ncbi:ribose-phosphate pyrophosphokinase [Curtobacterium sp. VKM Ac-2861]|uniref:phosphoribosyltransferase family protein n=1 Tax=unclassified Curtobacterium TaxID=257496 RepID=UPI000F48D913|nr:phosphoribosyltransferase family protein [Curtobacterium sp. PhB78]NQW89787.1 ribose-phosphate pyrophosphokinase [Curtobacterium sp. VKM Ac-2861]ROS37534.1 ribose-phosphate pyrophosphokinase [Curtobacterium sp. PhB78]
MAVELSTWDAQGNQTTATFSTMRFPAGEAHVKVANDTAEPGRLTEIATLRGTSGDDLIMLGMWADAVRQRGSRSVALVPYLPGARQDRGLPFGAKVYADVLNGFHLDQVIAFDPHSPVIVGLVDNLTVVTSEQVVRDAVVGAPEHDGGAPYTGIIAPDKGAVPRATAVAEACGLPLYRAEKHRNPDTGKLDGFTCEPLPDTGRFLVVDDICDGGGTFMGLAGSTGLPQERLGLWVSHGVFSGRAAQLADHFGEIVTTDSYPAQNAIDGLRTIALTPYLTEQIR